MPEITVDAITNLPVSQRRIEIVERKGRGHPDTICDALMDSISIALCAAYLQTAGRILHHNLDKGLLVAGQSLPGLGGGTIQAPMRIIFGDRATHEWQGRKIPVGEIVEESAVDWFRKNLRFVDPRKHLLFQNEIHPGSPELVDIFARDRLTANDTSAAVGYAPLSETERIVLFAEQFLNTPEFKTRHPEAGEDVKVMGVRREHDLKLIVAVAFVDRFIESPQAYFRLKTEVEQELVAALRPQLVELDRVHVQLNTLDDPTRGVNGMYLTVLGTSAEGADGGEVGRGNRVNGLISFHRPMSLEAAAGKNPVSHVGKIYNLLSHHLANQIYSRVDGLLEVYVWLCSQIGQPIENPWSVSVDLVLATGVCLTDVEQKVCAIIHEELSGVSGFTSRLSRGELPVC